MQSAGSVLLPRHKYTNILLKVAFVIIFIVIHFDADFVPLHPPPAKWSSCTDAPPHLYSLSSSSHLRFPFAPGWFLSETQSNVQCCYKHQDERLELCSKHTSITLCFFFFFFSCHLRPEDFIFSCFAQKCFDVVCCCTVTCLIRLKVGLLSRPSVFRCNCLGTRGEIKDSWKA